MSVQNDKWIIVQSSDPTGEVYGDLERIPVVKIGDWCYARDGAQYWAATSGYRPFRETHKLLVNHQPMIEPFVPHQVKTRQVNRGCAPADYPNAPHIQHLPEWTEEKIISYGLSSYGYDVRLASDFKVFSNIHSSVVDPKKIDDKCLIDATIRKSNDGSEYVLIPPNSYLLGHTVEYFRIPRDILVVALGKSTYARAGCIINVTPIEPGFEGQVVIEISNSTPSPMKVYANEGIAQFIFLKGNEECMVSYGDRAGKYQGQRGITLGKV